MRNQLLGNRYRIIDRIGEGGMAYVYVAKDEKLGRKVAVKVLHEHMHKNPELRKRFQMEAQAISALEHPNIVKIYDFSGTQSDRLWIVTEVIRGKNLAQHAQATGRGWLHPILSACIVREICKALDKAHHEGIIHRDIKPENIMITNEGRVKLMDFGIAKDLGKSNMTVEGTFMGSPSYMSPEQIRGRDVDLRSDLYSLAILFYEIVTGRLPFSGQTTHEVILKILDGEFTHPRYIVPTLPPLLNEMIIKGMNRSAEARFQSAREMGREIDLFLGSLAFDESHVELERYFKDPHAYASRLEQVQLNTVSPRPGLSQRQGSSKNTAGLAHTLRQDQAQIPSVHAPQRPHISMPTPAHQAGAKANISRTRTPEVPIPNQATALLPPPPQALQRGGAATPTRTPINARQEQTQPYNITALHPGNAKPQGRRPTFRYARRDANPVGRRTIRNTQINPTWTHVSFGALLVGMLCFISLWGFWGLKDRLNQAKQTKPSTRAVASPTNSVDSKDQIRKPRDGTPSVVKHISKKQAVVSLNNQPLPGKTTTPNKKQQKPKLKKVATTESVSTAVANERPKITKKKATANDSSLIPSSWLAQTNDSEDDGNTNNKATETTENSKDTATSNEATQANINTKTSVASTPNNPSQTNDDNEALNTKSISNSATKNPAKGTEKQTLKASLTISSQPAAEIYINGKRMGTTNDATASSGSIKLDAGSHTLELRRKGYKTYKNEVQLSADEKKTLPQIILDPDDKQDSTIKTNLTIRVNASPVTLTIRNLDSGSSQTVVIKTPVRNLSLDNGRYLLRAEYQGDAKERELRLTGSQITFSAEFKPGSASNKPAIENNSEE